VFLDFKDQLGLTGAFNLDRFIQVRDLILRKFDVHHPT
jgi:hypothetical protein